MFDRFTRNRALDVARRTARQLISVQGESNAQSIAVELIDRYRKLDGDNRIRFFEFLAEEFNPDPSAVKSAADAYHADPSHGNLARLLSIVEPKRQELLRRINRAPEGTAFIIAMRNALLPQLATHPAFASIDADMHHLLGSWFNPGFLELHRITWQSPAQLLERIIEHESVHAIDGWEDLRRRLQLDRRCYAFFHPQLPGEPLIFVEVALVPAIATSIAPLIDKHSTPGESRTFKVAIFYSISNCQPGLKGVSLGNFLIKRVVQKLIEDVPSLKTFSTLSPIPGFTRWLDHGAKMAEGDIDAAGKKKLETARTLLEIGHKSWAERIKEGWQPGRCSAPERDALLRLCVYYLRHSTPTPDGDAVAKFHLSNGATLHRVNWAADPSRKGIQQSAGIMVNYLYDLDKVEAQHEAFINGRVIHSRAIFRWD